MRGSLILSLVTGLVIGLLLSNQFATSQENSVPPPAREGRGRYQIAGHSTYPPLLLDTDTGASWILMSTTDGEARRWLWEQIDVSPLPPDNLDNGQRGVARVPEPPRQQPPRVMF
jgi:hypothetical protein